MLGQRTVSICKSSSEEWRFPDERTLVNHHTVIFQNTLLSLTFFFFFFFRNEIPIPYTRCRLQRRVILPGRRKKKGLGSRRINRLLKELWMTWCTYPTVIKHDSSSPVLFFDIDWFVTIVADVGSRKFPAATHC